MFPFPFIEILLVFEQLRQGSNHSPQHNPNEITINSSTKPMVGEKGFMRMVYFKKLLKDCNVDDCHMLPALRYFHDAGWVRFYGFDESQDTGFPLSEGVEGFEHVDAYRSTGTKIATNSSSAFRSKVPPSNVREKDWANIFDTIIINLSWFTEFVSTFILHDASTLLASVADDDDDMQMEAITFIENATLIWRRGSPVLITHLWGHFMPESDFRIMRNLFVASQLFQYHDTTNRNLLDVPCLAEERKRKDRGFYISFDPDFKGQKREIDIRPFVKILSFLTKRISEQSVVLSSAEVSDAEARCSISKSTVFIIIMTDSYFDSLRCRTEYMAAVDLCLHLVPIITSDCSSWPPNADAPWLPNRNNLYWPPLSRVVPFDLSLVEFSDILAFYEDDESVFVGLCGKVHIDPVFTHLLDKIITDVPAIQTVQVDYCLEVYRRFQKHLKTLFVRLAALFCRKSLFPSSDEQPRGFIRTATAAWHESKDRASRARIHAEELQSHHDISGGTVVSDESADDVNLRRIKESLQRLDPWRAKLSALKEMANIHKGLGTAPLWHLRDAVMQELEHQTAGSYADVSADSIKNKQDC